MMKKLALILMLSFLLIHSAYAEPWFYNAESVEVNLRLESSLTLASLEPDYRIEYVKVNLSFFPFDTKAQKVQNIKLTPQADIIGNAALFQWDKPDTGKLSFDVFANIKTNNEFISVKKKIPFPVADVPGGLEIYTQPSKTIDSDAPDVIRLASSLAEGEDDLYAVVYKLAQWTKNNIKYDLSTLTAEISQKSSWVLRTKQGVCDELTNLFIAMNRALGIPARFISGVAYTDSSLFPEKWGAHGWAEVWFPGYGWVPWDVTYGEFGFVDPTHIKLKESLDGEEPSTQYIWYGRNIDIKTEKLDIKADISSVKGSVPEQIGISIDLLNSNLGFGSYNLITAEVENLAGHYYAAELYISRPKELSISPSDSLQVLLRPYQKKKIYWIIKVPSDLKQGYEYTFPIGIQSLRNITEETQFSVASGEVVLSEEYVNDIAKGIESEEQKVYSKNVNISCRLSKEEIYQNDDALVSCAVKNTGNVFLESLDVCLSSNCSKIDLGINQENVLEFPVDTSSTGYKNIKITMKNNAVSKTTPFKYTVLDKPQIEISSLEYPKEINFDDAFTVQFTLLKKSLSTPENVNVILNSNGLRTNWFIEKLNNTQNLQMELNGRELSSETSDFDITVQYEDKFGNKYDAKDGLSIKLVNLSSGQKSRLLLNSLAGFIRENIESVVSVVVMGFLLINYLLLKKRKRRL